MSAMTQLSVSNLVPDKTMQDQELNLPPEVLEPLTGQVWCVLQVALSCSSTTPPRRRTTVVTVVNARE